MTKPGSVKMIKCRPHEVVWFLLMTMAGNPYLIVDRARRLRCWAVGSHLSWRGGGDARGEVLGIFVVPSSGEWGWRFGVAKASSESRCLSPSIFLLNLGHKDWIHYTVIHDDNLRYDNFALIEESIFQLATRPGIVSKEVISCRRVQPVPDFPYTEDLDVDSPGFFISLAHCLDAISAEVSPAGDHRDDSTASVEWGSGDGCVLITPLISCAWTEHFVVVVSCFLVKSMVESRHLRAPCKISHSLIRGIGLLGPLQEYSWDGHGHGTAGAYGLCRSSLTCSTNHG